MPPDRFPPDDPREWLDRARSNLVKAQEKPDLEYVYLEDLRFDAQQAAEKAIKAVLIHSNVQFPYTHDLARLLSLVEQAGVASARHCQAGSGSDQICSVYALSESN